MKTHLHRLLASIRRNTAIYDFDCGGFMSICSSFVVPQLTIQSVFHVDVRDCSSNCWHFKCSIFNFHSHKSDSMCFFVCLFQIVFLEIYLNAYDFHSVKKKKKKKKKQYPKSPKNVFLYSSKEMAPPEKKISLNSSKTSSKWCNQASL